MKFDVKKHLVDPLISKKIGVPDVDNVMFLKDSGMFDNFNELVEKQRVVMFGKPWKIAVPVAVSVIGAGGAALEYVSRVIESGKLQDAASLMIKEAEEVYNRNN